MTAPSFARLAAALALSAAACGDATSDLVVGGSTQAGDCDRDSDCRSDSPRCDEATGRCVQCRTAGDCPTGQVCSLPAGVCVRGCVDSTDCPAEIPVCDADAGLCHPCTASAECPASTPICNDTTGRCVECITNGHCSEVGEQCSKILGECATPCSAAGGCPPDDPICDGAIGFCVECRTDEDCAGSPLPFCRHSECTS